MALAKQPAAPKSVSSASFAVPQMNMNAQSIFDLMRAPQQPQFNVTQATGTKPKNYVPASINVSGMPVASVFGLPGAAPMPDNVFTVTPASGTKPKNYKPATISMNAPQLAGPQAMQQMLEMMRGFSPTPFAPYGQG